MSLIPFLLDDYSYSPSRIFNSSDFLSPNFRCVYVRPRRNQLSPRSNACSVACDKDKFQVNLDVQHFKPDEISVKVTGENVITVEAKHEEKEDEHGFVSRQFVRRYTLPEGHDIQKVESRLSSDGVLTITAPKINKTGDEHRHIPIQQTGVPSKAVENVKEQEKKE